MGTLKERKQVRSLDRLKNLDALGSLDAQLQEARLLCNTSERASMITRWLLGKLKKGPEAQYSYELWILLRDAIRLQNPDRAATILAQSSLINMIQAATEPSAPTDVSSAAIDLVVVLLAISESSANVGMRSFLRLESGDAAVLLSHALESSEDDAHHVAALKIWALRKVSKEDHDTFAQRCLVAATNALVEWNSNSSSRKRGRNGESGTFNINSSLERLLAQHIFQPARLAFFAEQSSSKLEEVLKPLKDSSASLLHGSAARLLDIALRCVASTTPKERKADLPWGEVAYLVLQECIPSGPKVNETISQMISVMHRRGYTLSDEAITSVITQYSGLLDGDDSTPDWKLLAQIVALNAAFFMKESFTNRILQSIPTDEELLDTILMPIVKAYARHRSLPRFLERWYNILLEHDGKSGLVGVELDDILEDSISVADILALVRKFTVDLESGNFAAAAPLAFVLSAVRSDELRDALQPQLHDVLKLSTLPRWFTKVQNPKLEIFLWTVLTVSFELWFPVMAVKAKDSATVTSEGIAYLQTPQLQHWLQATESEESVTRSVKKEKEFIHAISPFVATVCDHLSAYSDCRPECEKFAARLVARPLLRVYLANHPHLLELCSVASSRGSLLRDSFTTAQEYLKDVVSHCSEISATIRNDLTTTALSLSQDDTVDLEQVVQWLSSTQLELLSQDERDSFLAILMRPNAKVISADTSDELPLRRRLAVMSHLVECSVRSKSKISNEVSAILQLVKGARRPETLALLGHLTASILEHLRALNDHEQLVHFVEDLVNLTSKTFGTPQAARRSSGSKDSKGVKEDGLSLCALLKACFKTGVLQQEQNSKLAEAFITAAKAIGGVEALSIDEEGSSQLTAVLDTLINLPRTCLSDDQAEAILELAGDILERANLSGSERAAAFSLACQHTDGEAGQALASLLQDTLEARLPPAQYSSALASYQTAISGSSFQIKTAICRAMLDLARSAPSSAMPVLQQTLLTTNKEGSEDGEKVNKPAIYADLLQLLHPGTSYEIYQHTLDCLTQVLAERGFLVNQHGVEATLAKLTHLVRDASAVMRPLVNVDACKIINVLLQRHDHRLKGRFHLMSCLLQALLSSVFEDADSPSASGTTEDGNPLNQQVLIIQAKNLSRTVTFVSNPRQAQSKQSNGLVDETRKAKAHVGDFARHVLHYYCAEVLKHALPEPIRQALLPGLFALIDAIQVSSVDGMTSLSAAMNNSQRNILRSLYDEWKRVAKWTGG